MSHILHIDYPPGGPPRYGYGRPPHQGLQAQIERDAKDYGEMILGDILEYKSELDAIPLRGSDHLHPIWLNDWFTGIDAAALYAMIRKSKPSRIVEIGSGHSTMFMRRAIDDGGLDTTIVSIDPYGRAKDRPWKGRSEIITTPFEEMDLSLFETLTVNDIVFVDSTHRVFQNSDVTAFFLDVLPILHKEVLVHFHDIFLPNDYPPEWQARYYSESYMLAVYYQATRCPAIFPSAYLQQTRAELIAKIFDGALQEVPVSAGSFWISR